MLLIPLFIQVGAIGIILVSILSSLFTALTDFFLKFVTKKLAMSLAAIAIMLALTATFITTLTTIISTVSASFPPEMLLAWGWFMPSNAEECLSAYFAAYTARWIYDVNNDLIFKKGVFGRM